MTSTLYEVPKRGQYTLTCPIDREKCYRNREIDLLAIQEQILTHLNANEKNNFFLNEEKIHSKWNLSVLYNAET